MTREEALKILTDSKTVKQDKHKIQAAVKFLSNRPLTNPQTTATMLNQPPESNLNNRPWWKFW